MLLGDRRTLSKGERQRRAILDSLADLLATRPIGELTVGEIAAAAGVRRSGYYFYFESKYSALAVATTEIWSELMERVQSFARTDNEVVADFLSRTAASTIDVWHEHEAVLIASIQAIPLDDQIASMWQVWNRRLSGILIEQILRDIADGRASPSSQDVPNLVESLLEMTLHMYYKDRLEKNTVEQTRRMLDTVRSIWLASIWGAGK
ncbi:TetR/AcrR family transcriptional regulator [Gordonia sp. ABSL11-1]|uniref:TetR/AcrR family transcriptional regulator n=1 Tax=Gordonia sp. ABSL11-1 TaxID=3053924 RepID=UPI0025722133|nr:TetR/AcrR family transcriptional regulator [Gordonia sp. ABSL11-1]MDL9946539.1 TetR/AcrR family transcriptional regulator [Gordonia sp. ABSL11-1]